MTTAVALEPTIFSVPNLLDALIRRLRALHAQRTRRQAVMPLLGMDERLLDDLGLNVGDVHDALKATSSAGNTLHARRRVNAQRWTPKAAAA
jgi:uncharacterized protein YjiS (DUF1127 family)